MTTDTIQLSAGNYILSYLGACDALRNEQAYLDGVSKNSLIPEAERAMAAVVAATIGLRLLDMNAKHELIMQRLQSSPNPPSEAQINDAVRLATALAIDIRRAAVASAVMDIVNKFVTSWTATLGA